MTLQQRVENTIKQYNMIQEGDTVIVGLSGGADSVCLLYVLLSFSEHLKFKVVAAHINHQIRGEDANNDETFVKNLCQNLSVPLFCKRFNVPTLAKIKGESVELFARNLRYQYFSEIADNYKNAKIATAHNANDNAETLIFNLTRGTGLAGMCGIPPVRNNIIRPLIFCKREHIIDYIEQNNLLFVEDNTNSDQSYSRNFIRHSILPKLVQLNDNAIENMSNFSVKARCDEDYLEQQSESVAVNKENNSYILNRNELLQVDNAIIPRVLRKVYAKLSYDVLSNKNLSDIISLISKESGKQITLANDIICRAEFEKLIFEKKQKTLENIDTNWYNLRLGKNIIKFNDNVFIVYVDRGVTNAYDNCAARYLFNIDDLQNITIRTRREGDVYKSGKRPTKMLKKLFIEQKVPQSYRNIAPVFLYKNNVIWVYGFLPDARFTGDTITISVIEEQGFRDFHS